jgi:hypothetical protein
MKIICSVSILKSILSEKHASLTKYYWDATTNSFLVVKYSLLAVIKNKIECTTQLYIFETLPLMNVQISIDILHVFFW